jgi:hypothetical protein
VTFSGFRFFLVSIGIRWNADRSPRRKKDGTVAAEKVAFPGFEFAWPVGAEWESFAGGDFWDKYLSAIG